MALYVAGIKPGDKVLVPTITFAATINAIKTVGARPVFMDCNEYLNIDVKKVGEWLESNTAQAIMPVHVFGSLCDMGTVMALAQQHNLKVIEDAAEALGAQYTQGPYQGRYGGSIGDFGVFSFAFNKMITSGNGGAIITNDQKAAEKIKYLITQAKDDPVNYVHHEVGCNLGMSNILAALGLSQIEQLDEFLSRKKQNYEKYQELFEPIDGVSLIEIPNNTESNYWFYGLRVNPDIYGRTRDELIKILEAYSVQCRPLWFPNHWQKHNLSEEHYRIDNAIGLWQQTLNIPCSSTLTEENIAYIVNIIDNHSNQRPKSKIECQMA
jgi:dTDP-4-amino-4,6-dideoxygalactose transaminase